MKTRKYGFIVWGTICHFWIDFTCACFAFQEIVGNKDWYTLLFLYNFYAFALELPMGTLLDGICEKSNGSAKGYFWTGIAGILLVILALATDISLWPAVFLAGAGNAAFHVGTGSRVLREFPEKIWPSGLFVSTGALGIYLGKLFSGDPYVKIISEAVLLVLLLSAAFGVTAGKNRGEKRRKASFIDIQKRNAVVSEKAFDLVPVLCIFMTVVLRSYQGMTNSFSWNQTVQTGLILTGATALGKLSGGIVADLAGVKKTVVFSLGGGGILLLCVSCIWLQTGGSLLFNMTMPVTLVLLYRIFPKWPGTSFGLLTFALFIGFLPSYFEAEISVFPFRSSLLAFFSLFLLWIAIKRVEKAGKRAVDSKRTGG